MRVATSSVSTNNLLFQRAHDCNVRVNSELPGRRHRCNRRHPEQTPGIKKRECPMPNVHRNTFHRCDHPINRVQTRGGGHKWDFRRNGENGGMCHVGHLTSVVCARLMQFGPHGVIARTDVIQSVKIAQNDLGVEDSRSRPFPSPYPTPPPLPSCTHPFLTIL